MALMSHTMIGKPVGHFRVSVFIQYPWQLGQILRRLNGDALKNRRCCHDDIPPFEKPFAVHPRPIAVPVPDGGIEIALFEIVHRRVGINTQIDFGMTLQKTTQARHEPMLGEMRRHGDVEDIVVASKPVDIAGDRPEVPQQTVGQVRSFRQHNQAIAGSGEQFALQALFQPAQMLADRPMRYVERNRGGADGSGFMNRHESTKRI
nr:hypothetical protein [uncultured Nitratireductor sp.]